VIRGGCFCGYIRYAADGTPFHETICHCTICRRTSGAPFVAWFSVPKDGFRLVAGAPGRFRSTAKVVRTFCPKCGTSLTFEHDDFPQELDVTTSSLDDPESLPPRDHTWTSSMLTWVKLADGLRLFRESRDRQ
jgi:hypothetical protein